ncbi:flagellar hook-basal body complex protein [Clostridium tagluense]|uniref:flagellar hook-basal body complex protein n=1 Tax=Clostridium tagluense TaxID=360422 RepID=UPI001C6F16BB|nr:flagellar hook-basal body complex protein [Clostridium tagluense]MBW9154943.1 flagellar hook-basal body complex protein [Clostridium tagluense]WLC64396.1 flagellar hook-basal body complex protein [Clostridium tagluense]
MLRSLYAGISGMKVNQIKLDVVGNNIANCGTTAFKSSRVRFQDMVSQSMTQALAPGSSQGGVNARQVGLGVQVAGIDTMVGQGGMQPTSRPLDVAMDGEGYLMVAKGVTPKGGAAVATSAETVSANGVSLKADYTVDSTNGMNLFYTRDGALTLDTEGNLLNSDGLRVLGYGVTATTSITAEDGSVTEGEPYTSLDYDANGKAILNYADANSKNIKTEPKLIPLVIPEKIGVPEYTNAAGETVPAGTLRVTTFSVEKDGIIKAVLEGGKVAILGQIAVASFKNPAGLSKIGGNIYQNTSNSGEPVVRTGKYVVADAAADPHLDNGAGYGDMLGGMLEMSNVDLAEQFTDMIIASRAFQAAGKTISTGDEILQDIIGLKR